MRSIYDSVDFVIVTALEEERDAVLAHLPTYHQIPPSADDVRIYYSSEILTTYPNGSTGTYQVIVLCLLNMGRVEAAVATCDAIRRWNPQYVLLVGIAGGISGNDACLGDVLVSDAVVDYELQKLTPAGPRVRYSVHRANPRLLGAVRAVRSDDWMKKLKHRRPIKGTPKRLIGPIATGDKIIAFSDILERYQDDWPKLVGIEMEAGGAASACFQSSISPGFLMVRGVSDLADEKKDIPAVKSWRSYACEVAASYSICLLESGPIPVATPRQQMLNSGELAAIGTYSFADEAEEYEYCTRRLRTARRVKDATLGPGSERVPSYRKKYYDDRRDIIKRQGIDYRYICMVGTNSRLERIIEDMRELEQFDFFVGYFETPSPFHPMISFLIFDDEEVIMGSYRRLNDPTQRKADILIKEPEVARAFSDYFEFLWERTTKLNDHGIRFDIVDSIRLRISETS